jgi:hypothetical protein
MNLWEKLEPKVLTVASENKTNVTLLRNVLICWDTSWATGKHKKKQSSLKNFAFRYDLENLQIM